MIASEFMYKDDITYSYADMNLSAMNRINTFSNSTNTVNKLKTAVSDGIDKLKRENEKLKEENKALKIENDLLKKILGKQDKIVIK
jgi:regulator of replication initiation timing